MKEKIKSAAKKVSAAMRGDAGILNTLEGEHAEVSTLMEEVLSSDTPAKAAEKHYPTIRKKLLLHTRAEQRVLYAACEDHEDTAEMIPDSKAEHQEIEDILQELDTMSLDAPAWIERFEVLQRTVAQHVADEENDLFPLCKDAFESSRLRDLDDAYTEAKREIEPQIGEPLRPRTEQQPSV